ncbi:MAG TPA: FAD-dependent oxidoreductase [Castellaniella sp.]|uniref:FAD-dependent oxidoreductase n=1 Tax=Castellaniella sp. TaxID=1955812 RepID=UPI002EF1ABD3
MAIYESKLTGRKEVAEGTMEFILEKPKDFKFRAGQFFDIILEAKPGAEKKTYVHGFSFVNAPYEDHIAAITRMRGTPFKNTIRDLPLGTPVKLDAVFGAFTLPKNESKTVVFLIGGVGITPVRSMIAQATHDKTAHKITLLYANDTRARAPLVDELQKLAHQNPNFTFVPVYSQEKVAGAEHGRVDAAMVKRHVPDLASPIYYLSGPPGMVRAMRELLMSIGADEDNIRTEEFDGY